MKVRYQFDYTHEYEEDAEWEQYYGDQTVEEAEELELNQFPLMLDLVLANKEMFDSATVSVTIEK